MAEPTVPDSAAVPSDDDTPRRVLVVDDERGVREVLVMYLSKEGYQVDACSDGNAAVARLDESTYDVVITDLQMPGKGGLEVLEHVKGTSPNTQVILITAYASTETAISAMKAGAYDYIKKPFRPQEIGALVEKAYEKRALLVENLRLRDALRGPHRFGDIIGKSAPMREVFSLVTKVADARTTILIHGESGTGKELIARAIHRSGRRGSGPFVAVNCGAIPENLLESELFGHLRGAFTGAVSDSRGLFVAASGGTLFLDEIGELPSPLQVKLLRVLQERKVKPVGGVQEMPTDARVVAATNRDLGEAVEKGEFRSDLYYRINVVQVHLPPLRRRREDIPLLAAHFLEKHGIELNRTELSLGRDALQRLVSYPWPGNVRELENAIERAVTLAEGEVIGADDLPPALREGQGPLVSASAVELPDDGLDLDQVLGEIERTLLLRALSRTGGVRKRAARLLGITFRSMRYRLQKRGIGGDGEDGDDDEPSIG